MLARMGQTTDGNGNPVTFNLQFIKEDGSLRKMRAQNHVKHGSIGGGKNPKSNFKYNLKKNRCVLLYDMDGKSFRSVKIDSITHYNNMEVIH